MDDFYLDEHMIVINMCGSDWYVCEDGTISGSQENAYPHFIMSSANRIVSSLLRQDTGGLITDISINVTNTEI